MKSYTDADLRRADAIRAMRVTDGRVTYLWGLEDLLPSNPDEYAAPHEDYIVEFEYETDNQLIGLMVKVGDARGRLTRTSQELFEQLTNSYCGRLSNQLDQCLPAKC